MGSPTAPPESPEEIPEEIPWQLASTTQPLGPETLGPDTSTISLFTYVPRLQSLDTEYPDDRLLYFKFTVSVSPMFLFEFLPHDGQPVDPLDLFGPYGALPIWRLLFDVRISPQPYVQGVIKPYFLTAAPLRRQMIETGVVGQQAMDGESTSLAIGKSGSQMHEGFSSTIDTTTNSANASWAFGGASVSDTSTTVGGSRDVVQHIDTTQRDAATERQELVSHMTNVTNVLTLLSASGVGTPYLRYSLWPRPLEPLAFDSTDPNLWYAELLRRRSSGIEGIQEFLAIAAVPRALTGFCIEAQLRRFSVLLPSLPEGKQLGKPGDYLTSEAEEALLEDHLYRRFPRGASIDDELDVAVDFGAVQTRRPVVADWISPGSSSSPGFRDGLIRVQALDVPTDTAAIGPTHLDGNYKTSIEVWLEMKRDEYEQELVADPLAGGTPLFMQMTLNTCFGPATAPLTVVQATPSRSKRPSWLAPTAPSSARQVAPPTRKSDRFRQAVTAWNAAENQLGSMATHAREAQAAELRFDNQPKVVDLALRRLAQVAADDPMNQRLEDAAGWFGLSPQQVTALRQRGITTVGELASAILLAPALERINLRRAGAQARPTRSGIPRPRIRQRKAPTPPPPLAPTPLLAVVSPQEADELRRAFGAMLQARAEQAWSSAAGGQ